MSLFIAVLATESNSFSPIPTGRENFVEGGLYHGDATQHPPNLFTEQLVEWRRRGEASGNAVIESLAAFAQPAGPTAAPVYEAFRDEIISDLRQAEGVEIVLLALHGAMIADGYDDCEGDLLSHIRGIVGPNVVIGATLDLHCHVTPEMIEQADCLITFKEYPHTDGVDRAIELYELCYAAKRGDIQLEMSVLDTRMIYLWPTTAEPMRSFVDSLSAAERGTLLSVSFVHGFPWGDVPHAGAKILAVTDSDPESGMRACEAFQSKLWSLRDQFSTEYHDVKAALDAIPESTSKPVVIADTADNAGGGAASDSTYFLDAALRRGIQGIAIGCIWDPVAVRLCTDAGVGATLALRLGGKCGPMSGAPVDVEVQVVNIAKDVTQSFGSSTMPLGNAVGLKICEMDVVINDNRTQVFSPDVFSSVGIDINKLRAVIVKSTQHFYAGFQPIASEIIYAASPGTVDLNFAEIPFTTFDAPYWPRTESPFDQ